MILSVVIGIPAGLAAALFNYLIQTCGGFFLGQLGHYWPPLTGGEAEAMGHPLLEHAAPIRRWVLLFLPALGGLVSGWLVYKYAPEAEGHGTDHVIKTFHHQQGRIRMRVPIIKTLASAVTIGTGGAAGREGPVAQIGAGVASNISQMLRLSDRERRILVIAGAGAGIGAIFRAPLGGAIFGTEVLYRDSEFEYEALIPSFIASIVAYSVDCPISGHGWGSIFTSGDLTFHNPLLLLFYLLLAFLVFLVGRFYLEIFYTTTNRLFKRMPVTNCLKPAIGGLLLGLSALVFSWFTSSGQMGAVFGAGYGYLQQAIDGELALNFMILLLVFKIFATSVTIGSGGSGGVFGPSIVIGGLTGSVFGLICQQMFPQVVDAPTASAFTLVGMAGFFAGVANVPVAALVMTSEMTSGYTLLVPLMLVTSVAYALSFRRRSIYKEQVVSRLDSPAHTGDFITDVLEDIQVSEVYHPDSVMTIHEETLLQSVLTRISESSQSTFPVVDAEERLMGLLSLDHIRAMLAEPHLANLLIARDISQSPAERLYTDETLNLALRKFVATDNEELPVVERANPDHVIGMMAHRDLIAAYNRHMQTWMRERAAQT